MIIQKFLPIFISGLLLCGCASGAVNSSSEMETLYTEVSKAETEDFVSTIDKENCFLCGSNRPGIFDYYKKSGCIALVCLNTWNIADTNVYEYDDNGKIVEEPNGFSTNINTHGENECSWMVAGDPVRHTATATLTYGDKGYGMDLLTLLKMFLFLGCICYTFTILSFIKRHFPRITWKKDSRKKENKEDGRNTEN